MLQNPGDRKMFGHTSRALPKRRHSVETMTIHKKHKFQRVTYLGAQRSTTNGAFR